MYDSVRNAVARGGCRENVSPLVRHLRLQFRTNCTRMASGVSECLTGWARLRSKGGVHFHEQGGMQRQDRRVRVLIRVPAERPLLNAPGAYSSMRDRLRLRIANQDAILDPDPRGALRARPGPWQARLSPLTRPGPAGLLPPPADLVRRRPLVTRPDVETVCDA
jgi:hypothetical protein